MPRIMTRFLSAIAAAVLGLAVLAAPAQALDPENTLYLDLKQGRVEIEMRPDLAPNHVKRIKELVRRGFYDGNPFHRVIGGFMAQTGDVEHGDMEDGFDLRRAGTGGSDRPGNPA